MERARQLEFRSRSAKRLWAADHAIRDFVPDCRHSWIGAFHCTRITNLIDCRPIGYLFFMIPLPAIIYYQITFPLQLLASRLGARGLVLLNVPTVREGNLLILPNCTLEVVEACSGVRSLLSLLAAVVGYAYLAEPAIWKRCVLVASVIPIVILSNGLRLVTLGELSFTYGPGVDSGAAHSAIGLGFFALAFLSVLVLHAALGRFKGKEVPVPSH
jgi:exosortase